MVRSYLVPDIVTFSLRVAETSECSARHGDDNLCRHIQCMCPRSTKRKEKKRKEKKNDTSVIVLAMKSTHIQVQKLDARVFCSVLDMIIQFNSREETKKNENRKKKVYDTRNFLFALCDHNAAACFLCACWLNGLYFAFCHVQSGT